MKFFSIILLYFLQLVLLIGGFIILGLVIFVYYCSYDLPDYQQLKEYKLPCVSRVYSKNNLLLSEYFTEYRVFIPINAIPQILINSFIAVEDKNFYSHVGVDLSGIIRSLLHNIRNGKGHNLVGGSTITQQVVKNLLLSNEKSLKRKVREAILAFKISRIFSKDLIMELYLNKIYFGHGSYGIVAASLKYFNKSVDELSLEEIALLAALPQAPSRLDPFKNKDLIKERRNWVLNRMLEEEFISQDECQKAKQIPIKLDNSHLVNNKFNSEFFIDEIKRYIAKKLGEDALYENGLFIRSTLIPEYQVMAERAVIDGLRKYDKQYIGWHGPLGIIEDIEEKNDNEWIEELKKFSIPQDIKEYNIAVVLDIDKRGAKIGFSSGETSLIPNSQLSWIYKKKHKNYESGNIFHDIELGDIIVVDKVQNNNYYSLKQIPKINGGLVMMDATNGKVLAMVGGYDYNKSQFNVAVQAKRQPGSIFKPFVYLAGLENNLTPTTIINDEEIEIDQGPLLPVWKPRNYKDKFYGLMTMRNALESSQNTVTVQIARTIGIDKVIDVAKRFNIYQNTKSNYAIALGSNEVSLLNMTTAYAMLANGGFYIEPRFIDFVSDSSGNVILSDNNISCIKCTPNNNSFLFFLPPNLTKLDKRVADDSVISQMVWLLRGSVQRGTSAGARVIEKTIAGKTGTSNNGIDNWFIGFWQNIVVGVYVGFDNPQTLGDNASGARVALPIFADFMKNVLNNKNDRPIELAKDLELIPIVRKTGLLINSDTKSSEIILEAFQEDSGQIHEEFIFDKILNSKD